MAADRTLQRQINAAAALQRLRRSPASIGELVKDLGLSRPAAGDVVAGLVADGWVVEAESEDLPSVGRPAKTYRFDASRGRVVGVDLGAHTVRVSINDLDGVTLSYLESALDPQAGRRERLDSTFAAVDQALIDSGTEHGKIWAIGVATPGVVMDGSVYFFGGKDMPGWLGVDLGAEFGHRYATEIYVEGDSASGAAGEMWLGQDPDVEDLVYILGGYRVGFGLILGGRLIRGHTGAAGLIGEMPELGWNHLHDYPDVKRLLDAAAAGDSDSRHTFDEYCRQLATGIRAIALTVDPQVVVIGGGIGKGGQRVTAEIERHLAGALVSYPVIRTSALGDLGVLKGIVRVALQGVERNVFEVPLPTG